MTKKIRSLISILWIGLFAGTLDISENLIFNGFRGITPWRVFQFITSGLIGLKSFRMGWTLVGLGDTASDSFHAPAREALGSTQTIHGRLLRSEGVLVQNYATQRNAA